MLPNTLPARTAKRLRLQMLRGRVGLGLVAGLSVLAGMTDAIGLLALGDFVSFMSGNTTRCWWSPPCWALQPHGPWQRPFQRCSLPHWPWA